MQFKKLKIAEYACRLKQEDWILCFEEAASFTASRNFMAYARLSENVCTGAVMRKVYQILCF